MGVDIKPPGITPMNRGGTNKNLTPVAGGIVYTDADSMEVTAAGTSGYLLQSQGTSAPQWLAFSMNSYTPSLTNGSNITSATVRAGYYIQIGSYVMVWAYIAVRPTASGGATSDFRISLPVASNLANNWDLIGTFGFLEGAGNRVAVYADSSNDNANIYFKSSWAGSEEPFTISFMYQII